MESHIEYDAQGRAVSFVGPDAVAVFQAAALRSRLGLMAVGIKPHRSCRVAPIAGAGGQR